MYLKYRKNDGFLISSYESQPDGVENGNGIYEYTSNLLPVGCEQLNNIYLVFNNDGSIFGVISYMKPYMPIYDNYSLNILSNDTIGINESLDVDVCIVDADGDATDGNYEISVFCNNTAYTVSLSNGTGQLQISFQEAGQYVIHARMMNLQTLKEIVVV